MDPRMRQVLLDLELEAEGLALAERADDVAALREAGHADLDLAARIAAADGVELVVTVDAGGSGHTVTGATAGSGSDWVALAGSGCTWLVPMSAVVAIRGLPDYGVAADARGVGARLSWRSFLRRALADERRDCAVLLRSGGRHDGEVTMVGADFLDVGGVSVNAAAIGAVCVRD